MGLERANDPAAIQAATMREQENQGEYSGQAFHSRFDPESKLGPLYCGPGALVLELLANRVIFPGNRRSVRRFGGVAQRLEQRLHEPNQ